MGAGTLGRSLAAAFCGDKQDVVVLDVSGRILKRLKDKAEVMTVQGDGSTVEALLEAGVQSANLFIAVSNSDVHNIQACRLAKHFGVKNTICRLLSMGHFDLASGFSPAREGIDHVVLPVNDCVRKIRDVLDMNYSREKIIFSVPDAFIMAFHLTGGTPLSGVMLKDFPEPDLLRDVRFSAIFREGRLVPPRGDTVMKAGDEVCLAGRKDKVEAMMDWIYPSEKRIRRVTISGGGPIGMELASQLCAADYEVRLIEPDQARADMVLEEIESGIMVINGDANERDILDEAGVGSCDAFVAVQDDDEDNILSCVLAKQMGARKVITLTNKEEYIGLVPTMEMIDCGFSKWLVAVNSVLRHMSSITHSHTNAIFHRVDAYVCEHEVRRDSLICDRKIDECDFPASAVLAMVFRDGEALAPSGGLVLRQGDFVTSVVNPKSEKALEGVFKRSET